MSLPDKMQCYTNHFIFILLVSCDMRAVMTPSRIRLVEVESLRSSSEKQRLELNPCFLASAASWVLSWPCRCYSWWSLDSQNDSQTSTILSSLDTQEKVASSACSGLVYTCDSCRRELVAELGVQSKGRACRSRPGCW